jgi:hypothetical protein
MFQRFYENSTKEQYEAFSSEIEKLKIGLSPAQIQGHLLLYKDRPEDAIRLASTSFKLENNN